MKWFLTILLFSFSVQARQIHIVLIDSGFPNFKTNIKLCNGMNSVIDLTDSDIYDKIGHGTNLLGIIEKELKNIDYCVTVIKIYKEDSDRSRFKDHLQAYKWASILTNVDIVNYSSSGIYRDKHEEFLINQLILKNILFITSAGNDSKNLDIECNVFPICYNLNIIGVGNGSNINRHAYTSNYGKVIKAWHNGNYVRGNGITMSGTSQATVIETTIQAKKLYYKSLKNNL